MHKSAPKCCQTAKGRPLDIRNSSVFVLYLSEQTQFLHCVSVGFSSRVKSMWLTSLWLTSLWSSDGSRSTRIDLFLIMESGCNEDLDEKTPPVFLCGSSLLEDGKNPNKKPEYGLLTEFSSPELSIFGRQWVVVVLVSCKWVRNKGLLLCRFNLATWSSNVKSRISALVVNIQVKKARLKNQTTQRRLGQEKRQ